MAFCGYSLTLDGSGMLYGTAGEIILPTHFLLLSGTAELPHLSLPRMHLNNCQLNKHHVAYRCSDTDEVASVYNSLAGAVPDVHVHGEEVAGPDRVDLNKWKDQGNMNDLMPAQVTLARYFSLRTTTCY